MKSEVTAPVRAQVDNSALLQRATEWLAQASSPVCIAGRGVVRAKASPALLELCERLPQLLVASTPSAKGVIPDGHRQALGVWGFCGQSATRQSVEHADVVLVIGTRLLEQSSDGWNPRLYQGRVIRVDLDPELPFEFGPDQLVLLGDANIILQQLAMRMPVPQRAADHRLVQYSHHVDALAERKPGLVHPICLMDSLNRVANQVPVCADAGNSMCWAIELLTRARPNDFYVSVDWGTMGFALPAALSVALARGSAAIALTGDGSMAMAGGDLHTAVELGLPLVVVVLNDSGAGMVAAGSEAWFGPEKVPNQRYRQRMDFLQFAQGLGAYAETVTNAEHFEQALLAALARPAPSLLDVHIDPGPVPSAVRARVAGLSTSDASGRPGGGMC